MTVYEVRRPELQTQETLLDTLATIPDFLDDLFHGAQFSAKVNIKKRGTLNPREPIPPAWLSSTDIASVMIGPR